MQFIARKAQNIGFRIFDIRTNTREYGSVYGVQIHGKWENTFKTLYH